MVKLLAITPGDHVEHGFVAWHSERESVMGFDAHGVNLLRYAHQRQAFGRVAMIGRQVVNLPTGRIRKLLGTDRVSGDGCFSESLLVDYFHAASVNSFDNSDYEGASHIVDMNKPIGPTATYDTVIDGGCLEHIYDIPQALANVSALCSPGGQILHILPANNFCGHGFWQMSPELFFSLYSEKNGYIGTEVFLADLADEAHWYQVRKPNPGIRANAASITPLYALVRTIKNNPTPRHDEVQQSDYVHEWEQREQPSSAGGTGNGNNRIKAALASFPTALRLATRVYWAFFSPFNLSKRNQQLTRFRVDEVLAPSAPLAERGTVPHAS